MFDAGVHHVSLNVTDAAARTHLEAHDVRVSEPTEQPGICIQCFFKDPTGNLIELNQPV